MTTVDQLPEFVPINTVAKRIGIGAEVLAGMSHRKEFARLYLFGKRKFYRLDEVEHALKHLVPGHPDQYRAVVRAIDAACPFQATRRRRGERNRSRGSSDQAS